MINSLRAIGYSFETAVADLIDNSITARANKIKLIFRTSPLWFAISDNGSGMSTAELRLAMCLGPADPVNVRAKTDLGRFGLGLKTASFSQCRRVTVISKQKGILSAARWDLDTIAEHNAWVLELPELQPLLAEEYCEDLRSSSSGTVVLWEKLDRALAGETKLAEALQAQAFTASEHIRLVFHRYLNGERGAFEISLNKRKLQALDPFLTQRSSIAGEEMGSVYGSSVAIRAYILPHISKLTAEDIALLGGAASLRDSQGFYIYRNLRLIIWGTWFRLIARHELSRLARVQVDITNEIDELWNLDVKKSVAYPPEKVRALLKNIVSVVADQSALVFRERRPRVRDAEERAPLWERVVLREGVRYSINRLHPMIQAAQEQAISGKETIESLLKVIELSLPLRGIYVDQANDVKVSQVIDEALMNDLSKALDRMLEAIPSESGKLKMLQSLSNVEPFSAFPSLINSIKEMVTKNA